MGNSYTRQSAADIIDGQTIFAAPLNAEFNALQNFADGISGHSHDGTVGEGPKINLNTSVTGTLQPSNGGVGGIHKLNATVAPTANDDVNDGYAVGSLWVNVTNDTYYICVDATAGAAVWVWSIAYNAALVSIGALTTTANQTIYTTASNVYATTALTPFGRTILDDVDAAAVRTTIGLGTIATQNSNSVSITGGTISGVTLSGTITGSGATLTNPTITGGIITGITDLAIADGGTGASDVVGAKTNFGLNNVDNTSDLNKPISTATQTALNGKSDVGHTHVPADIIGLEAYLDPWAMQPLGAFIFADDGATGFTVPPTNKAYRYVELTAGLTGAGQYNQGILTGESTSGSSPNITATATVSLSGSPFNGTTINLLNTERIFMRPGSQGTRQASVFSSHSHGVSDPGHAHSVSDPGHNHGVNDPGHSHGITYYNSGSGGTAGATIDTVSTVNGQAQSSRAISANGSGTGIWLNASGTGIGINGAGTGISIQNTGDSGGETRPRNVGIRLFRRIK